MTEKIGGITIDDTCYPGKDLYCDGEIEDRILEIVKNHEPAGYGKIIEEERSWPVLYHLSHLRENIVNWIPVQKTDKVLEVGSGCGAITGALSVKAGEVTCVELSRKRSLINVYRHPQCDNVTIKLGNFQDVEPALDSDYDYIFLIGVFEYAGNYIGGNAPFETFMGIMQKHLAKGGRLIIAIENRFGLKYWAGCKEDHLGTYFDSIEGYPRSNGVRTFTRKELEEICKVNGISEYHFYYPYPDYKFMTTVYSDERLPKIGELSDNMRNFDRDRLLLFDEKNVFDSLIREEMFPSFSNSYLLVVGRELPVIYAKFSNDRAPEYAIRTEIRRCDRNAAGDAVERAGSEVEKERKALEVRKIPLTEKAQVHVGRIADTYQALEKAYRGSGLKINRCRMDGTEAVFEYLPGQTLEELLDRALEEGDRERFLQLFYQFRDVVKYPDHPSVYHYDLIFSNIIIDGPVWNLIDYEWVSDQKVTREELILRSLYCYGIGGDKRKKICLELIRQVKGWEETERWDEISLQEIVRRESAFQKHCTGNRMSMVEMRDAIGCAVIPAVSFAGACREQEHRNRIQIYEDYGDGFSEVNSCFLLNGYGEKELLSIEIEEKPGLQAIRLDPSLDYCMVRMKSFQVWGQSLSLRDINIKLNGKLISDQTVVFATQDPNIAVFHLMEMKNRIPGPGALREGRYGAIRDICLKVELEVIRISREMAESIVAGITDKKQGIRRGVPWFQK